MNPLIRSQRCGFDDLFVTAAIGGDGKTQRTIAGIRREEHILRGAIAKIEDALPGGAAVPIHPGGIGEVGGTRHQAGREHDRLVRSIQAQRGPVFASDKAGRTVDDNRVVGVAGSIAGRAIERIMRHDRGVAAGPGDHLGGIGGSIQGTVHGLDDIKVILAKVCRFISERVIRQPARDDGIRPAVGGAAQDGVTRQIRFTVCLPVQLDGNRIGGGDHRRRGRRGHKIIIGDRGRNQPPLLVQRTGVIPLQDRRAAAGGSAIDAHHLVAPAAANFKITVGDVLEIPLFHGIGAAIPLLDRIAIRVRIIIQVRGYSIMRRHEGKIADVAAERGR